jgi:hypothetical protein
MLKHLKKQFAIAPLVTRVAPVQFVQQQATSKKFSLKLLRLVSPNVVLLAPMTTSPIRRWKIASAKDISDGSTYRYRRVG